MGEYRSAKLIIVVEGIIDGEVFGKIRIPGGPVDVETIESLIKDTIGRKEWRVETKAILELCRMGQHYKQVENSSLFYKNF